MARALGNIVNTVLVLNVAIAYIRGSTELQAFGTTLRTPSFPVSLLLLVLWAARDVLRGRGHRLTLSTVGEHAGRRLPETIAGLLFVVGLVMRLTGIGFGAPLVLHPDEHVVVGASISMLKAGSLAPPVPYHYPTVFYYLLLPAFALTYVRGKSRGAWTSLGEIDQATFPFYEVARAHSAVLGALTILLTFVLARRMWPGARGRWAGVIAATCVTFAFNHVKESHHAVTDAALTFFVTMAFIAIVAAFHRGSRGSFAIAGFATGIACATKYSALPLVPVLLAAHVLAGPGRADWRRAAIAVAAVAVGFFAGYPYALLNWPPFLEHLGWMSGFGSRPFDAGERFAMIVKYSMESGLGAAFTLAFAAAAIAAIHRRRRVESLVVVFTVVALSLLSKTAFSFYARYLLPILPLAAVLVGALVVEAADWLRAKSGERGRVLAPAAAVLAVLALVIPQAREAIGFIGFVTSPDTRVLTYRHILEHVAAGATIASEEPYLVLPDRYRLLRWTPLHDRPLEQFIERRVDVLVMATDRDVLEHGERADRRRELRRRYPLRAAFPAGRAGSVGPTLEVRVRPVH
jgi:4-amino-4-deoxy-L-arabinose transferase-like glycosyltransferase